MGFLAEQKGTGDKGKGENASPGQVARMGASHSSIRGNSWTVFPPSATASSISILGLDTAENAYSTTNKKWGELIEND